MKLIQKIGRCRIRQIEVRGELTARLYRAVKCHGRRRQPTRSAVRCSRWTKAMV